MERAKLKKLKYKQFRLRKLSSTTNEKVQLMIFAHITYS